MEIRFNALFCNLSFYLLLCNFWNVTYFLATHANQNQKGSEDLTFKFREYY